MFLILLPVRMYAYLLCLPSACGDQKTASDPLKLELSMIVSCYVGAGDEPGPLQECQMLLSAQPPLLL